MLTRAFTDKIVFDLVMENHIPIPNGKFGCAPCLDSFIGYINPEIMDQAIDSHGFIGVAHYPDFPNRLPNEIGAMGNMRIVLDKSIDPLKIAVETVTRKEFTIGE
jgi:hypothetical protein